jgi:hypothetical protein
MTAGSVHGNTVVRMGPADVRHDVGQALCVESSVHAADAAIVTAALSPT